MKRRLLRITELSMEYGELINEQTLTGCEDRGRAFVTRVLLRELLIN